jgi:hypothetical protein
MNAHGLLAKGSQELVRPFEAQSAGEADWSLRAGHLIAHQPVAHGRGNAADGGDRGPDPLTPAVGCNAGRFGETCSATQLGIAAGHTCCITAQPRAPTEINAR